MLPITCVGLVLIPGGAGFLVQCGLNPRGHGNWTKEGALAGLIVGVINGIVNIFISFNFWDISFWFIFELFWRSEYIVIFHLPVE